MKTNLFKVKKIKEDKITVEEEELKWPFLIFFRRYGCLLGLLLFILTLIILLIVITLTISGILKSTDPDNKYTDEDVAINGDANIKLDDSENNDNFINKYANAYKKEGIIFVEKTFTVGDTLVVYYSDGSSKIVYKSGTIKRVSALANGDYGIDENANININVRTKDITIKEIKELPSGTKIVYYSDNSAEITKNGQTILVRNSDNIVLTDDETDLKVVDPSGASYQNSVKEINGITITYYTDGTIKVDKNGNTYIVRNEEDIEITANDVIFPNHNEATIIAKKTLNDNTVITYYSDGSAFIEAYYDTEIMVRKSGDIVLEGDNSFYEILKSNIAHAKSEKTTPNGVKVTYYDNGAAVIEYPNGTKVYVEENSNIKFDDQGNIKKITEEPSPEKQTKTLPDGTIVVDFENGKSRVITPDGDNYIIDTKELIYDTNGNIKKEDENLTNTYNEREEKQENDEDEEYENDEEDDEDDDDDDETDDPFAPDPGEGSEGEGILVIIEKDDKEEYYDVLIRNQSARKIYYRIVIEETSDYNKYSVGKLDAYYVKYQLVVEQKFFQGIRLNNNVFEYEGKTNYVLYDGELDKNNKINLGLSLYIDYAEIDNEWQNTALIGTIKVYIVK